MLNARSCIRLLGVLVLCCSVLPAGDARSQSLTVSPPQISVTADYPGQFVIAFQSADGVAVDLTENAEVQLTIGDPLIASVSPERSIIAKSIGTTELRVEYRGQTQLIPIVVGVDSPLTFTREVSAAISRSGCNLGACHGNLHGKGGLRLSLRGDDPFFDFQHLVQEYGNRRIDSIDVDQSLLLRKATARVAHQGGERFTPESASYNRIARWIQDGANWSESPKLKSLTVTPKFARIDPGQRQAALVVTAEFDDGSQRDVTPWARIEPSLPAGVRVTTLGRVIAERAMDVSFNVSYLDGRAASRIVFLGKSIPAAEPQNTSNNIIDALVQKQLEQLRLQPEPLADDWTLVRRMFLAVVGRLPTPDEAREYVADQRDNKREHLVDRLLADPGFDLLWAMRWSDLLRNEDKVMSPKGTAILHKWLREQSASDRSVRDMVAELTSSVGSTYDNPPASYYRTHRDPFVAVESSTQVFLGARMQCAKCHNHPFDVWRQDDYYGLAAFFTTIDRKQIDNKPKDELDKHIITGDEIISLGERTAEIVHPGRSIKVQPSVLPVRYTSYGAAESGSAATESAKLQPTADPANPTNQSAQVLLRFSEWLTQDNRMFDRNMANRVWSQYFGRGIVDPPDDFRESNPPSNPELLDYIAAEFKRENYSVRKLSRMILTSDTFARGTASDADKIDELSSVAQFGGFPIRRLPAEMLMDAIIDVTGVPSEFRSGGGDDAVVANKAMSMPGIPKGMGFLTTFGKPNRLLDCECERSNQVSLGQSLLMVNGVEVRDKLTKSGGRIDELTSRFDDPMQIVDELYLAAITRWPTEREKTAIKEYVANSPDRRQAIEDVLWSLLNSKEFIMLR